MTIRIRSYAQSPATAEPKAILVWPKGRFTTSYGDHWYTDRSAARIQAEYEARGLGRVVIDVEHGLAFADPSKPPPIAGYARLEFRSDGLYAIPEWSTYGLDQVRSGQRTFFSPEYTISTQDSTDAAKGEVIGLFRLSLVADPATYNAERIAAAAKQSVNAKAAAGPKGKKMMNAEQARKAIDIVTKSNGAGALKLLAELVATAAAGGEAPAPANDGPPKGDAPPEGKEDEAKQMMAARMGLPDRCRTAAGRRVPGGVVFGVLTADDARAMRAAKGVV